MKHLILIRIVYCGELCRRFAFAPLAAHAWNGCDYGDDMLCVL